MVVDSARTAFSRVRERLVELQHTERNKKRKHREQEQKYEVDAEVDEDSAEKKKNTKEETIRAKFKPPVPHFRCRGSPELRDFSKLSSATLENNKKTVEPNPNTKRRSSFIQTPNDLNRANEILKVLRSENKNQSRGLPFTYSQFKEWWAVYEQCNQEGGVRCGDIRTLDNCDSLNMSILIRNGRRRDDGEHLAFSELLRVMYPTLKIHQIESVLRRWGTVDVRKASISRDKLDEWKQSYSSSELERHEELFAFLRKVSGREEKEASERQNRLSGVVTRKVRNNWKRVASMTGLSRGTTSEPVLLVSDILEICNNTFLSNETIKQIIEHSDRDEDGALNFEEFCDLFNEKAIVSPSHSTLIQTKLGNRRAHSILRFLDS